MTDKAQALDIELPPLPPPFKKAVYATSANTKSVRDGVEMGGYEKEPPLFDDAQMLEYARAAVLADRKRKGVPAKDDYYGTYDDDDLTFNLRGFYSNERELIDKGLIIPLYTHPQPPIGGR